MKSSTTRKIFALLLLGALCFPTPEARARLPKPIKMGGIVLAIHRDSQTLMFKPAKTKKPFLLDWNQETEFKRNGKTVSAIELKEGTSAIIFYKDVSFHNPLLKQVSWTDSVKGT